jgi:leader peptidase (prepilin peptidase)/N-methyltransferase
VTSVPVLALGSLVGLCAGSYVTTAALRAAHGEQSVLGRSHCDGCGMTLNFLQTTPVLSFVSARGACRACGARIDPLHLVGELCGAALGVLAPLSPPTLGAILVAGLGLTLLASAVIDARTRRLPNGLTFLVAVICLSLGIRAGSDAAFCGAVAALGSLLVLEGLRRLRVRYGRDPGLGFGDVKLICALALWLGVRTPWMVVLASVLGLVSWAVWRPADGKFAFGPMIAIAGFGVGLAGEGGLWPALT